MEIWDRYDRIFHYTNQEGLEGILNSNVIHATHFKYLNDEGEVEFVRNKLVEKLKPHIAKIIRGFQNENLQLGQRIAQYGGLDKLVNADATTFVRTLYRVTFGDDENDAFVEPYIISFCGHVKNYEKQNGLLSQWRAYGQNSGYALEFDTKKVWDIMQAEAEIYACGGTQLEAVSYDVDEYTFDACFEKLIGEISLVYGGLACKDESDLSPLFGPFVHGVTRYKHRGFAEESEVRAVLYPQTASFRKKLEREDPEEFRKAPSRALKDIHYKPGMKPYLKLADGQNTLPITKIVVGPHREKQQRADVLKRFLKARGMVCPVQVSETPFV